MKPRWLYLLLILALLLPGARPRLAGGGFAAASASQGAANTSETEEEEVHERTATSRLRQKVALTKTTTFAHRLIPQFQRFVKAASPIPAVALEHRNGFGGNITC